MSIGALCTGNNNALCMWMEKKNIFLAAAERSDVEKERLVKNFVVIFIFIGVLPQQHESNRYRDCIAESPF